MIKSYTSRSFSFLDFVSKIRRNRTSTKKVITFKSSIRNTLDIKLNNIKNGLKALFVTNQKTLLC